MDWLFGLGLVDNKTVTRQKWAGNLSCKYCQQQSQHTLMEQTVWTTLLWIKVIPARRDRMLTCHHCRSVTKLKKEEALQVLAVASPGAR
ncbi:MAG TPA: hypothetical protein VH186_13660 [Chloroflexia bacterium]|nr:hypothetical protein [Chloroflexia bacterium]